MASFPAKRLLSSHRWLLCNYRSPEKCPSRGITLELTETPHVKINRIVNKAVVTLDRPTHLNALSLEMIRSVYSHLRRWEMDHSMTMVIVKGAGGKAFCSGGDVKAIAESGPGSDLGRDFFREEYRMNNQIGSLSIPYIAFLCGIVMGGGVGLSVHGAYRVATDKAIFSMPETAIGFFPDVGGSHFLPRLPGNLGLYLALTGHRLYGRDLFKAGIATHFLQSDKLEHLQEELFRLEKPDLKSIDQILSKYQEQWWEEEKNIEFSLKKHTGRIKSLFNAPTMEGIIENLKKDNSDWSNKTIETLMRMSPTSLKVTFRQLQEGAQKSLPECLKMEYIMSQRFMAGHDFYEGIRAVLIDKDNNPRWNPPTLEEVTDEMVDEYFKAPPGFKELQL